MIEKKVVVDRRIDLAISVLEQAQGELDCECTDWGTVNDAIDEATRLLLEAMRIEGDE